MATKKTKRTRRTKAQIEAAKDRAYAELGVLVTNIFNDFVAKEEAQKHQK